MILQKGTILTTPVKTQHLAKNAKKPKQKNPVIIKYGSNKPHHLNEIVAGNYY